MLYPKAINDLIDLFSKFPGIGAKNAERMAFHVVNNFSLEDTKNLGEALDAAKNTLKSCKQCGFITDSELCLICESSDFRDSKILMIVENNKDLVALEKSGQFNGLFHVLGGAISPMNGIGPDDLRITELLERVKIGNFTEIILATNPKIEGETTALYIINLLKDENLKITKLGYGLPVGSELEYADELTLMRALESRKDVNNEKRLTNN